jgi:hypothetical protein
MNYSVKPLIEYQTCLYVGNVVRQVLYDHGKDIHITTTEGVEKIKDIAERYTAAAHKKDTTEVTRIKLDHLPSNLGPGKGFIFFFLCPSCSRRSRYLYATAFNYKMMCRKCHRLGYKKQRRSDKRIMALLKDERLLLQHMESPRWGDKLLAMKALITRETLEESCIQEVVNSKFWHV